MRRKSFGVMEVWWPVEEGKDLTQRALRKAERFASKALLLESSIGWSVSLAFVWSNSGCGAILVQNGCTFG